MDEIGGKLLGYKGPLESRPCKKMSCPYQNAETWFDGQYAPTTQIPVMVLYVHHSASMIVCTITNNVVTSVYG